MVTTMCKSCRKLSVSRVDYARRLVSSQRPRQAVTTHPRVDGRRYVVTGGAAGMGYFTAERLAGLGAEVVIAARNPDRATRAMEAIRGQHPGAMVSSVRIDLANLESVRDAAEQLAATPLHGVVANAGVLPWDRAGRTADGFEPAFGTNQLGHFALLAQLTPALAPGAAIVQLGSMSSIGLRLHFDDLMHERRRAPRLTVYGRSKLAVMTTAIELDRRARAAGSSIRSVIAHPGFASGAIDPARGGIAPDRANAVYRGLLGAFGNSKQQGAEVSVTALLSGASGEYWGPNGWFFQLRGTPTRAHLPRAALDAAAGASLWTASEELTGVEWRIG